MIAVSMRMTRTSYSNGGQELRDALAHDWWRFFRAVLPGVPVLPVPNVGEHVEAFLCPFPLTGLVLTGGDDWDEFPERDTTEEQLIRLADCMSLPVLGVCRGAQVLNLLAGGKTSPGFSESHVQSRHSVQVQQEASSLCSNMTSFEVNSYHKLGIRQADLAPGLEAWATAPDGSVEAFFGGKGRVTGVMWHPEREEVPAAHDIRLVQQLFRRKAL